VSIVNVNTRNGAERQRDEGVGMASGGNGAEDGADRTILVIDDDVAQRACLAELLARGGYDVVVAADGQAGIELLREGLRPTLIVLDLAMPRMDGWSFLVLLRGTDRSKVPVLVMSGEALGRAPEGADAWLQKPLDAGVFSSVVARLFAWASAAHGDDRGLDAGPPAAIP
jgi:CheY-like chemotaxis protein